MRIDFGCIECDEWHKWYGPSFILTHLVERWLDKHPDNCPEQGWSAVHYYD